MNSRRLIASPEAQDRASYRVKRADWKGSDVRTADVRFGSKADMCIAICMSALPPKADIAVQLA